MALTIWSLVLFLAVVWLGIAIISWPFVIKRGLKHNARIQTIFKKLDVEAICDFIFIDTVLIILCWPAWLFSPISKDRSPGK